MAEPKDLVFNPSKGIASSPLEENAFSQCVDNDTVRGVARVNFQTETQVIDTSTAYTFTRGGVEYVALAVTAEWNNGVAVTLSSTGDLPTGWSAGTVYYLRDKSSVYAGYWSVHATYDYAVAGTNQINSSDAGSGTFTVTPTEIKNIKKFQSNRAVDSHGNLWERHGEGNWELLSAGAGSGVGMEKYGDHVYIFRGGDIDRYKISDGTVTAGWQSDTGGVSVVDADNYMYVGVGNVIRSYDGTTYNASALTLPSEYSIKSLGLIGRFLAIGLRDNKILLWDKIAVESIQEPISTQGEVEMLIPADGLLYFVVDSGDIYVTNGSTASLVKEFPRHILGKKDFPSLTFSPNAWRVQGREIYIGYGSTTNGSGPLGVYQYNLKDGDFKLAYILSSGETGETDKVRIDAIQNSDTGIFLIGGTQAGSTYEIDRVSITKRYTGYEAVVYSPLYKVGTKFNTRTYKHTEVSLSEKLKTGQGVRVSYRKDLSANWVVIDTFDNVGEISKVFNKALPDLDYIQLKTELTTNNDEYTPNTVEIRLW